MCICSEGKYRFDWKERRRSPYHLKIGLDCFRAHQPTSHQPTSPPVHQSDQIYCEDFVIVIVIIVIFIIIITIVILVIMIITFRLYERYCSRIQSDQGREGGLL